MNLSWIDWTIVLALLALMIGMVLVSKRLMRSVPDFLAAGRTGGRYVISMFQGTAALGAITISFRWFFFPTSTGVDYCNQLPTLGA